MEIIDSDIKQWNSEEVKDNFGDSVTLMPSNDNLKELQTILRDKWVRLLYCAVRYLLLAYYIEIVLKSFGMYNKSVYLFIVKISAVSTSFI